MNTPHPRFSETNVIKHKIELKPKQEPNQDSTQNPIEDGPIANTHSQY